VFIGIGAAINFVKQKEAPLVIQKIGMEWFYRLLKEPRRLWRRYLIDGPKFVFVFIFNVLNLIRGKI
jgi:N-acetylglucosaminyldiphosphoundecaprenol N-acetyl-beta-D-mannosaminyltransferase